MAALNLPVISTYGAAQLGASVVPQTSAAPFISLAVAFDWTRTGTYVDESSHVHSFTSSRGRANVNDQIAAGQATLTMRNIEGRFSPFNPLSPLYGQVIASVPVRVTASYRGAAFAQFAGVITEANQTTAAGQAATQFLCYDAFDQLRSASTPGVLGLGQQNVTSDECVQSVLDAYGWSGTARALDAGRALPTFAPSGSVLNALQLANANELGGICFVDKSGNMRFESAQSRPGAPLLALLTSVESMKLNERASDLISEADLIYDTYTGAGTPGTSLYTLSGTLPLPYGLTRLQGTWSTGALSVSQPTATYALGTTLLVEFSYDAAGFQAIFKNVSATQDTLTGFSVNGTPITKAANSSTAYASPPSPLVTGQLFSQTADFVTDWAAASAWAQGRALTLGNPNPRPVTQIVAKDDASAYAILAADLSSKIWLQDAGAGLGSGPWLSGLNSLFFIEQIALSIVPRQIVSAQWTLFGFPQGLG